MPPTPDSPATKPEKKAAKPRGRPRGGGQAKSVTSRRLNNIAEAADHVDEAVFKDFDYRLEGLDEYTPERCAELEAHYWRSLGFNQPMYAADMPGSLFDETTNSWNVAKLENLLDVLGTKVPGVNTAYLYMGMWKATFAWHLEDVDLYSINYIHFGAPKQWYSISQEDARKFEHAMKSIWPVDAKNCDQFLRHKTYLISPDVLLKQYNVKVNKLVHYEGEFVITYPYGYHSGYNLGYNCAESVNFATESWLEFGRIARKCNCEADNVWVDVAEIERKLRGEPTPEYYEMTDDEDDGSDDEGALPSPPASVKGKPRGRKRKRDVKEEKPKKKKKIRIRIKGPTREPCAMCPNENPWEPLLPTDNGKKVHLCCAAYTPETFIDKDDQGNAKVCGVTSIDRARLELKCNFCHSKRGACFQCSSKKCTRAFHATCAPAAGVQVDAGMVPTFGEDGTEYFEEGYDFRCRYHRPKMPKTINLEAMESSKRVLNYAREVKVGEVVQAQYVGQEVFAGLVVETRPGEMSLVVDVLPDGYVCWAGLAIGGDADLFFSDRVEVEWKWLCVLDPVDSQRPKPSTTALPMPAGMNKGAVSVTNRQDGVPTQEDVFHDNPSFKWHDFYNPHMPPPGYESAVINAPMKLKVDVEAADQLFFYLPTISTEAKCFFSAKAGSADVAPKANFIDRVTTRTTYQYPTQRPTLAPARPNPTPGTSTFAATQRRDSNDQPHNQQKRPYIYKPKQPTRPNVMWGVDPQALASQRSFLADGSRRSHEFSLPQPHPQGSPYSYAGSDPALHTMPARAFPREHYYSSETLPAAFPGEYSGFIKAARRGSQSSLGYAPEMQQSSHVKNVAPVAPMMGASGSPVSMPPNPNPYTSITSRPSSSARTHQSPIGTPASTATRPEVPPGFLENLTKYPYLKNSWLRKQSSYESPYPVGGGFSAAYLPLTLQSTTTTTTQATSARTPSNSVSEGSAEQRATGMQQQWTPPSQTWHSVSASAVEAQTPPPYHPHQQPRWQGLPQPTYQTTQEFQQSFLPQPSQHQSQHHFSHQQQQQQQQPGYPSTASRDGAQARRLREQGYGPYAPHSYAGSNNSTSGSGSGRNSFGQSYDTAGMGMWQSPRAPTPSPLSEGTGSVYNSYQHTAPTSGQMAWMGQGADVAPMGGYQGRGVGGRGHEGTLPQMGGGYETWRFG